MFRVGGDELRLRHRTDFDSVSLATVLYTRYHRFWETGAGCMESSRKVSQYKASFRFADTEFTNALLLNTYFSSAILDHAGEEALLIRPQLEA